MTSTSSADELVRELLWTPDKRGLTGGWLLRAASVFAAAGDTVRAQWMRLERDGYDPRTEPTNLADMLGPGANEQVVQAVLRARLRHGKVLVSGIAHQWPHFFVEPVDALLEWESKVAAGGALTISVGLEVPPGASGPHALSFPRSVFAEVLDSIALEAAAAIRSLGGPT